MFLGSVGTTLAAPYIIPASALVQRRHGANERIQMACIGTGGQGRVMENAIKHKQVRIVAL